ncbi:MAG: DUF3047 domain-containing protein [Polaromonas sp.]|nr:DUF3047 domain-containing protein [Polaromonas sp.]
MWRRFKQILLRWRLDQPLTGANLRSREGDDSPLKVCALFSTPIEKRHHAAAAVGADWRGCRQHRRP